MDGREVVIVEAVRTPVGRGHPEKGYYRDVHPNELLGARLRRGAGAGRRRSGRGRGRRRRLRAAIRRAVVQHRPQRLAPGRAADRDACDDHRPAVRSAQQAVNFAAALIARRRPRRGDRRRRRAHGPYPALRQREAARGARVAVPAGAARPPSGRPPGPQRGADRRDVGRHARGERRDRPALAAARRPGDAGGAVRARDRSLSRERTSTTDQGIRPETTSRRSRRSSRHSRRTGRSPRATRRRSPTVPRRCC